MSWTFAVEKWLDKRWISSAQLVSENLIRIIPGHEIENFGFNFSRDVIPIESGLKLNDEGEFYTLSFTTWDEVNEYGKEVWSAFCKRIKNTT